MVSTKAQLLWLETENKTKTKLDKNMGILKPSWVFVETNNIWMGISCQLIHFWDTQNLRDKFAQAESFPILYEGRNITVYL